MSYKTLISLISCLLAGVVSGQNPILSWAGSIGSDSTDFGTCVTTDASGNVYNAGSCMGNVDFDFSAGSSTLAPSAGNINEIDAYITKTDAAGNLIWAKRIGDSVTFSTLHVYRNGVKSIKLDVAGNIYLLGYYQGTVDFDPGPGVHNLSSTVSSPFHWQTYVLKLDASGNFLWAKDFSGIYFGLPLALEIDASANLYITGYFNGTIDLDPSVATFSYSSTTAETYFVKLDPAGNLAAANRLGSPTNSGNAYALSLALDPAGNIYTTGFFFGTIDFDTGAPTYTLNSSIQESNFILKLDPLFNFVWAKQFGGNESWSTVLDAANIYLTGNFSDTSDFDPGPGVYNLVATGNNGFQSFNVDQFVLKLDLNGNFVWAKSIASVGSSYGVSIRLDAASNIYASGYFLTGADFDPGTTIIYLPSSGGVDGFIQKLDPSGNLIWAKTIGGTADDYLMDLKISNTSDVLGTGYFSSTCNVDPGSTVYNLNSEGIRDAFVFKWSQCSSTHSPTDITSGPNKVICANESASISAVGVNPIGWYATPTGTLSAIGNGTNYVTPPLTAGNYTFYAGDIVCAGINRTAITVTVMACTGLEETASGENKVLNVYPVPSPRGLLTVEIKAISDNSQLSVYNALGQLILTQKIASEKTQLDLSAEPNGIYLLRLVRDNKLIGSGKIIKD